MRRKLSLVAALVAASMTLSLAASAHDLGPCGEGSGRGYAQHHIVPLAKAGIIGHGHIPGTHQGFSICR